MPQLRASLPDAYLLHSSWAFSLMRHSKGEAYERLGISTTPVRHTPSYVAARAPWREAVLEGAIEGDAAAEASMVIASSNKGGERARLVQLAQSQLDSAGVLILSFVTSAYDELSSNFAAHLRRASIRSYLLVTFSAEYQRQLVARGEVVHLHELPELRSGGSDKFASRDFFLVNSARWQ